MDHLQIVPIVFAALVVFAIYRRFRRNFGRQPLRPARMSSRIALLAAVACLLVPMTLRSAPLLAAMLAGAALGVALGVWGSRRTRFVTLDTQLYYVPHTYTGVAVSILFFGRLIMRVMQAYSSGPAPAARAAQPFASAALVQSPITLGLLLVLIGYYVCYYSMVLWKSKHIGAKDIESATAAASQ
jgi:hypothetical protein